MDANLQTLELRTLEPYMSKTTYGGRLRNLRTEGSMSMKALAKEAGVSLGTVNRLENWPHELTNPTLEVTAKLAKALGTTVCFFFTGEDCCGAPK